MTAVPAVRTLRPLRHLAWRTTAAGNIAIVVPGATVAIVISVQAGRPLVAGLVALVSLLAVAVIVAPALRMRTRLEQDGITTFWTGRLGHERVARSEVRRAVIRTIYNGDEVSTNRHLFLLDAADTTLYRMNDRWWTDEQLLTVAHHFDAALESQTLPVHLAELRRTARHQLRWSERHSITAVTVLVAVGFLLCVAFALLVNGAL